MNKAVIITAAITAVGCAFVLVSNAKQNANLAKQIESESGTIRVLEDGQSNSGHLNALPAINRTAATPAGDEASEERIAKVLEQVNTLVASTPEHELNRLLQEVVSLIGNLDLKEVLALAQKVDGVSGSGQNTMVVRQALMRFVAEHDPELVAESLGFKKLFQDQGMVMTVLAGMAENDPDAAMKFIEGTEIGGMGEMITQIVKFHSLRDDFGKGLATFREDDEEGIDSLFRMAAKMPLPYRVVAQVGAALDKPENADIRLKLTDMMLENALFHRGLPTAREVASTYGLTDAEIGAYLVGAADEIVRSDPQGGIGWMLDVQTPEQQEKSIPKAMKLWAAADFNAAGTFLGEMEASKVKDQSIAQFSNAVVPLDPAAAATWALEIADEDLQRETYFGVVRSWRERDMAAANAWEAEQGGERVP